MQAQCNNHDRLRHCHAPLVRCLAAFAPSMFRIGLAVGMWLNYNPYRRDVTAEPSRSSAVVPMED